MRCIIGHTYSGIGGLANFTVTKSNPSGNIVRFAITDTNNKLTTTKMIAAVLRDAIDQFIVVERADLNTNGDSQVKGFEDYDPRHAGDGYRNVVWDWSNKRAELTLTALTGIASTGTITVAIPYGDVI